MLPSPADCLFSHFHYQIARYSCAGEEAIREQMRGRPQRPIAVSQRPMACCAFGQVGMARPDGTMQRSAYGDVGVAVKNMTRRLLGRIVSNGLEDAGLQSSI